MEFLQSIIGVPKNEINISRQKLLHFEQTFLSTLLNHRRIFKNSIAVDRKYKQKSVFHSSPKGNFENMQDKEHTPVS